MGIITAGYDTKTGEIFGCKEKSMAWWHEKGHEKLHNIELWKSLEMYNGYVLLFIIACLISNLRILATFFFLAHIWVYMMDEVYAWAYAFKHKSEWIK